jgi:hypothetical protein
MEVSRYRRSSDPQQQLLDPAHQEVLLKTKRKAPESTRESVAPQTTHLLDLRNRQATDDGTESCVSRADLEYAAWRSPGVAYRRPHGATNLVDWR